MSAPPPFYLLLKEVEAGVEEVGEGRMVGKEGIGGGGGKRQGEGGEGEWRGRRTGRLVYRILCLIFHM